MMKPVLRVDGRGASAVDGRPELDRPKAAWNGGMLLATLVFAGPLFSPGAFALFLVSTYASLLVGHSVGMHRFLIHRSFDCGPWTARVLLYVGTLVGVAGPFGIVRIHDLRDWAQREPSCHPFFSHERPLWLDVPWQLGWRFRFDRPPAFRIEPRFGDDPFLRWLERRWRWQQLQHHYHRRRKRKSW